MKLFVYFAALVAIVVAAPSQQLDASDTIQCGKVSYKASAVQAAADAACQYVQDGDEAGSSSYPHRFNNHEGFDFDVDGPYDEFPILKSGRVYNGGSPGPDRVIISDDCDVAGVITHTGASGNKFVGCSGTS